MTIITRSWVDQIYLLVLQVEQPINRAIQLPFKSLIKAPNLQQNVSFPFHFSANFRQQKNNPLYANLFFPWNRVADRFNNINLVSLIVLRSFLVGEIGQKLIDHNSDYLRSPRVNQIGFFKTVYPRIPLLRSDSYKVSYSDFWNFSMATA